jgi:glycosyltransferase involved in cell wall biosynthesis
MKHEANGNDARIRPLPTDDGCGLVSVIVPMNGEEESVQQLVEELLAAGTRLDPRRLEIVLVDDGSTDGTWKVSAELCEDHGQVVAVKLRRNFGKGTALSAGFKQARGEYLIMMDGDLQDDPKHLPEFVEMLDDGYDVVSGWKRRRHDPWHKVWPSWALNCAVRRIFRVPVHDLNCGFKGFRRHVIDQVPFYGELYRYVVVMAKEKGFKIGEVPVDHRQRQFGRSKFGWIRMVKGFLDLLTVRFLSSYQTRPLHLLGTIGLGLMFAGSAGLVYLSLLWMLGLGPIGSRPLLSYSGLSIIFGTQMITLGILAELIVSKTTLGSGHKDSSQDVETILSGNNPFTLMPNKNGEKAAGWENER